MKFFTSRDKGADQYGALSSNASIDLEEVETTEIKDVTIGAVKEDEHDEVASLASGVSSLGDEGFDSDVLFGEHDSDDEESDDSDEESETEEQDDKSLVVKEQSSLVRRSFDHGNHDFETKNHSQAILVAGSSQTARSRPSLSRQNSVQSVRSRASGRGLSRQNSMQSVRTSASRTSGRGLVRQNSMQPMRGLQRQSSMTSVRSSARRRIVPLERSDGPSPTKDGSRHAGVTLDGDSQSTHSHRHKTADFHPRPRRAHGVRRTATDSSELQAMRVGLFAPKDPQKEVEGEHPRRLLARAQSMDDTEALALRNAARNHAGGNTSRVKSSHNPRRRNSVGGNPRTKQEHNPDEVVDRVHRHGKNEDEVNSSRHSSKHGAEGRSSSKSKKKHKDSDESVSTHVTSKTTKSKKPKSKKLKDGEASVSTTKTKGTKKKKHKDGEDGKSVKSTSKHHSRSGKKIHKPLAAENSGIILNEGDEPDHVKHVKYNSCEKSFLQLDLA